MFDFCAVIGYDIDKKPNLDLILKKEYQAEILQIYPHHLKKSPIINESISQCFPKGEPYIYTNEGILHPQIGSKQDKGTESQIHQFQVQLDDLTIKYCYAFSFYETAYIQPIETLAGNRVKVLTWSPQLEIDFRNLINSKQSNVKVFIQKSIIIVCDQNETGCDEVLVSYVNKIMSQQLNINQQHTLNLQQLLQINQELLKKQCRLPQLELLNIIEFLNQQIQVFSVSDFDEHCKIKQIPIMKFIEINNIENSQITQDLYHLHDIKINKFNNPPDKLKQYKERVEKSKKRAKKPLIPIQPQILITKPIIELNQPSIRGQEFSFHESSDRKHQRNQIFSGLNFPQYKQLLKL